jgi:hypothetical protein
MLTADVSFTRLVIISTAFPVPVFIDGQRTTTRLPVGKCTRKGPVNGGVDAMPKRSLDFA